MKDRIVITILVIILGMLIFRLGLNKFGTFTSSAVTKSENMEVIRSMSELENQQAYEKYLVKLAELNETTSCNEAYLKLQEEETQMVINQVEAELSEQTSNDAMNENNDEIDVNASGTTEKIGIDPNEKLPEYSKMYPDLYVDKVCPNEIDHSEKVAYLTFDDGPSENTLKILKILEEKNAVATFFVLGSTMTKDGEEALIEMTEIGCKIGIHTYSHKKSKIYSSVENFLEDFYTVYTQIYEITGEKVNIFRFPWGSYNSYSKAIKKDLVKEMERRGFTYYDWNVSAEDSVGKPTENSIMRNIMKDVIKYKQPVILMHDSSVNDLTVKMLPKIIDKLIELGYTFDTLDHRKPCQFCY